MRSMSRRSSLFCSFLPSRGAASSGLTETLRAAARKSTFHMPQASRRRACTAVRFCNDLFLPQVAVGVFDVAPELLALLGRHLLRPLGALLAVAVHLAHVLAHALAVLLLHLALLRPGLGPLALIALGERAGDRHHKHQDERQDFHRRDDKAALRRRCNNW